MGVRGYLSGAWLPRRAEARIGVNLGDAVPAGRVDVLGVGISAVDLPRAVAAIAGWIGGGQGNYVCVTGVHGVIESQRDPDLRRIHNASGMAVPDGAPMVWAGRWSGAKSIGRVRGPDLMLAVLATAAAEGWRSFFYGGKEGVPELLAANLGNRFPNLHIVGTYSPPFRPLSPDEDDEIVRLINDASPDLVWVGLGTPKQERWMADHAARLDAVMLGVGAAFDIHAGLASEAPRWIQRSGFEWLYRLGHEPRRLWRRYLTNNPRFVLSILRRPPALVGGIDAHLPEEPAGPA